MEVYLNNAATSWPKPECVYGAVDEYLRHHGASQGRGSFKRSQEATGIIESCRQNLARLFNVDDPKRFVFTKNCSEALNLAIKGDTAPWRPRDYRQYGTQLGLAPDQDSGTRRHHLSDSGAMQSAG